MDIVKDNSRFAHFRFLESSAQDLFGRLAQERHLRGLVIEQFVARAAY